MRSCPDSIFHNRTRPCLQYQIKRCTAPCVGRIGQADYAQLLEQTRAFLAGRSDAIQDQLKAAMADASERLEFEQAAAIRDRLKALAHITSRQGINVSTVDDADVIALAQDGGQACVQVFFYRAAGTTAIGPTTRATCTTPRRRSCWTRSSASSTPSAARRS